MVRRTVRSAWIVGVLLGSGVAAPVAGQTPAGPAQESARAASSIIGARAPQPRSDGRLEYAVTALEGEIQVDGSLGEPAWADAVVIPLPFEVNPGDNEPAPVETECRLAHDDEHLYLGCAARDPEPDRIRAYIVDRDGIGRHDRIVLTLDPFNDQRRAFQFGVSALGVQFDGVLAQQGAGGNQGGGGGAQTDASWDAIWSSSGTITDDGFVVEAAIPFRSLRFPAGSDDAAWGVYLSRWWPRSADVEVRSATWNRDDACLLCQANVVTGIRGGAPGANVQLTPTFTGAHTETRDAPASDLATAPLKREIGLDAQWGITTDITLNLTANPDFSQVEADVAQLDVNNRFALFFPEKRPFFLEGADFFGTPLQAVFTRSIVDPTGGAKLTGKLGGNAVGVLVAQDRSNNLLIPGSQFSAAARLDDPVVTGIARFRRDIGDASTIGALYTGREGNGYHNRVGGLDAFLRPVSSVTLQAQLLRSSTEYPASIVESHGQPVGAFTGDAVQLRGEWSTNDWYVHADARQIDPRFRADAGFVNQAGVRGGSVNATRRWWGGSDRWFNQIRLSSGLWRNQDYDGNQLNGGVWFGLGYTGPLQTSVGVWPNLFMREYFAGTSYDGMNSVFFDVRTTPSGNWSLGLNGNVGDAVDFANRRLGHELRLAPTLDVRIGRNVEASLQHTVQMLDADGARVFTANLSQLRGVYNFSTRSFLRAIVQYRHTRRDPSRYVDPVDHRSESIFAQLLYAYKLNPQTVFFLGYSQDGAASIDVDSRPTSMTTLGRTFFLKLGYAWRP